MVAPASLQWRGARRPRTCDRMTPPLALGGIALALLALLVLLRSHAKVLPRLNELGVASNRLSLRPVVAGAQVSARKVLHTVRPCSKTNTS